jgi:DNA-binding NtrC family response regulator
VPPLRERREDIPTLAIHFLRRYASRYRREIGGFDTSALQVMAQYAWPGNVRELEHTLERAVLMCRGRGDSTRRPGIESAASAGAKSRGAQPRSSRDAS